MIRIPFDNLFRALVIAIACCGTGILGASEPESQPIRFNDHVRPIFNRHCTACHGGVKQAAGISFVYKEQVLPPDGWIVEPGDPDSSLLIERVLEEDPDLKMPPPGHGAGLSENEIDVLQKWIQQGAEWNASYWSYAAPENRAVPDVVDPLWPRQPLDSFVLSKLDREQLEPSADATPDRWLRRVSLDLTGLPPTPEHRQEFLEAFETSPDAARIAAVDRLLDSPSFGERWASVWLDQVRYADSQGLGMDGRRQIWKYRDWVINAFNEDLPYDQFTIKQIAGDLLPKPTIEDQIATAAHRLTQTNEEGGTDDEEFRIAAVLDRVSTTWQTWQGVTFGCVQCHSHPYDPFRHEEFYEFAAFFNSSADCDLTEDWPVAKVPLDDAEYTKASSLDRKIRDLKHSIWESEYDLLVNENIWRPVSDLTADASHQTKVNVETVDDHQEYFTVDTVSSDTQITLESRLPEEIDSLSAIRLTVRPRNPEQAVSDSEWGFVLSQIRAELIVDGQSEPQSLAVDRLIIDEPEPFLDPQLSLNADEKHGFGAYTRIHHSRRAGLILKTRTELPKGSTLRITLEHKETALGAFPLVARRGYVDVSDDESLLELSAKNQMSEMKQQFSQLQEQRKAIESISIPVMKELPHHLARPTHVFERGLFLTKGDQVTAGTPESLPPLLDDTSANGSTGDHVPTRLDLAKWLVRDDNPLTARVAVNRFWARLFGVGLVATEEDFGSSGDLPSHPELLDFLALRFQNEQAWSMKQLLREIVLSRTYGQSSRATPSSLERDPENRLLARGPRYRLSSEIIRDQALAVSGLLSDHRFGPPVQPPIPKGVWTPFKKNDKWNVPRPGDERRYRRSIYTYTKRSIPYPMFAAFDAPSREFCTPRRLRSNTPVQALMMLNDETFIECAQALTTKMTAASDDPREQIRAGFQRVVCREPADEELDDLQHLLETYRSERESDTAEALQNPLQAVATVLLNLDEVVMK